MHKKIVANGGTLTKYHCPQCNENIDTVQPTEDLVDSSGYWDSAKTCINCGGVNWVKTWPDGKTEVIAMPIETKIAPAGYREEQQWDRIMDDDKYD